MATKGSAILGALMAVGLTGIVGAGMVATYDSYVRRARVTYVKAAMTSLDNKIRHLAMQPGAYQCGGADGLGGVESCTLNETPFFDAVKHVVIPGACPAGPAGETTCGFRLEFDPEQPNPALKRGLKILNRGGVSTGVLFYALRYEGADFSLRPGGQNWNNDVDKVEQGMVIPREVLQSDDFDCQNVNGGTMPVFQGFDARGKPVCRPFTTCPTGQYATAVNFKTMTVTCANLRTPDKIIRCAQYGQYKVSAVRWAGGQVVNNQSACSELPEAPLNATILQGCPDGGQRQADGQCFYSNRWCRITSADPNSQTLGFGPGNTGAQHGAGCGADRWYQTNEVRSDGNGQYYKCLTGPFAEFPLSDARCPVAPTQTQPQPCPAGQTRQPDGSCRSTVAGGCWVEKQSAWQSSLPQCATANIITSPRGACSTPGDACKFKGLNGAAGMYDNASICMDRATYLASCANPAACALMCPAPATAAVTPGFWRYFGPGAQRSLLCQQAGFCKNTDPICDSDGVVRTSPGTTCTNVGYACRVYVPNMAGGGRLDWHGCVDANQPANWPE